MNTAADIIGRLAALDGVEIEIVDVRGDDDVAQREVVVGHAAANADDQQELGVEIGDDLGGELLGGIVTRSGSARDSNRAGFAFLRLHTADAIGMSTGSYIRFRLEPIVNSIKFFGKNRDKREIYLHTGIHANFSVAIFI